MSQYAALGTTCMACSVRMRGTKAQSPQTKGICEHFRKTILNEFYSVALLKRTLDAWIDSYRHERTHQGKNVLWANVDGDVRRRQRICS